MKKTLTVLLFALALTANAQAQTTVVTGTATDSQSTPYILGTWTANLKNTSSAQPTWQGSTSFNTSYSGSLDNTGAMSVTLPSNTGTGAITVGGLTTTQWTFSICALDGGSCFTSSVTITGASQSITASLVNSGRITFRLGASNQPPCGNNQVVVSVGTVWGCAAGGAAANGILDALSNGFVCNGSTDDTTAMTAALATLYAQGGGTLLIPAGKTCLIAGQITIPTNGAGTPSTKPIRITSFGNSSMASAAAGIVSPNGGGILNLTFNSATGKIDARGVGYLEIDHLILEDTAADCAAFIFDTNSVLHAHDNEFYGTATFTSACNDAIVLGGTVNGGGVGGGTTNEFQGYGTVIRDNFFAKIKRAVWGREQVNGIQIIDNTIWANSGNATGGAIEFTINDSGNYIAGNLIEITNYQYGIWFNPSGNAVGNTMIGNSLFDWSATNTAGYRFETNARYNFVIDSFNNNLTTEISDAPGTNTYLTSGQSVDTVIPGPWTFTNSGRGIRISGNPVPSAIYDILNGATNDEFFNQVTNSSNNVLWNLVLKPQGGANVNMFTVQHSSGGIQTDLTVGSSADTTDRVLSNASGTGADLKLMSGGSGRVVWLCGGAQNCVSYFDANGYPHIPLAWLTETAPPSGTAATLKITNNPTDHTLHFNANNNGDLSLSGAWSCTNVTPVTLPGTSTTADQNLMACTIPAGTLNRVGRTLRVKAKGIYSTPAASVSQITIKLELCTVSGCGSGTVITPISIQSTALGTVQITNDNFSLRSEITTQTAGASSAYEASGEFLIDLSTLTTAADSEFGDTNTATVGTIDSTAQLFLQTTIAFSVASASNVATQRQLIAETVN